MRNLLLLSLVCLFLPCFAQARRIGNESGGGGGVLAKLLVSSQDYLRRELPRIPTDEAFAGNHSLRKLFSRVSGRMPEDLAKVRFVSVNDELTDQSMGYRTWIRILAGSPMVIEYNPSPELFSQLVDTRLLDAPRADETPRLRDVMAFLLHEMGHYYGLGEEDAWRFALGIQKELDERSAARLKACTFTYADPSRGAEETLAKSFTLGGMDAFLFTTPVRAFSIAHAFRANAKPQLVLSITNTATATVELSLFIGADSQINLLQTISPPGGFVNLQCEVN